MIIIGIILSLLTVIGVVIPFAHDSVSSVYTGDDIGVDDAFNDDEMTAINPLDFIIWVWRVVTWDIGNVPFWISVIWALLLTILSLTIARNIWIGGGS